MNTETLNNLRRIKHDFDSPSDLAGLIHEVKDKKIVMLGEASHGTHEYYRWRDEISRILLKDHGFDFIAVEGDWPPCYTLNRHVKNYTDSEQNTRRALKDFSRWPTWMWANEEILELVTWMKEYNRDKEVNRRKGFYGLDVYSLWESLDAIMDYLEKEDPSALKTAREAMRCFEPHRDGDGQRYAYSTRLVPEGCRREVTEMLQEIRAKAPVYNSDPEHAFSTEQNALIARNAEEYYRVMVSGGGSTWNLRDRHMMDTLHRLMNFHGDEAKGIVWAHNTHVGDASYTDMADDNLFNMGQLGREECGRDNVSLIGFGSYRGSVVAGRSWGAPAKIMDLPQGRSRSWEELCHRAGNQFYLLSKELKSISELRDFAAHRAVGVVYNPEYESFGNYVPTIVPERYDAFIFIDETRALDAIDTNAEKEKTPETYPSGR